MVMDRYIQIMNVTWIVNGYWCPPDMAIGVHLPYQKIHQHVCQVNCKWQLVPTWCPPWQPPPPRPERCVGSCWPARTSRGKPCAERQCSTAPRSPCTHIHHSAQASTYKQHSKAVTRLYVSSFLLLLAQEGVVLKYSVPLSWLWWLIFNFMLSFF